MNKSTNSIKLTGKQARVLRGLGHSLRPCVMIGKQEITDEVLQAVDECLDSHELIKVRVQEGCLIGRREVAVLLSEGTQSAVAQVLGKTILLYRPSDEHLIKLP